MSPANINVKKRKKEVKHVYLFWMFMTSAWSALQSCSQKKLLVTKELQERLVLGKKGVKTPSLNSFKEALKIFQRVKVVLSKILRRPTALVMSQVNATVNSLYWKRVLIFFYNEQALHTSIVKKEDAIEWFFRRCVRYTARGADGVNFRSHVKIRYIILNIISYSLVK